MSGLVTAKELREKRANLAKQAQELLDRATAEKRELNAEESVSFDKFHGEIESLRGQVERIEKLGSIGDVVYGAVGSGSFQYVAANEKTWKGSGIESDVLSRTAKAKQTIKQAGERLVKRQQRRTSLRGRCTHDGRNSPAGRRPPPRARSGRHASAANCRRAGP